MKLPAVSTIRVLLPQAKFYTDVVPAKRVDQRKAGPRESSVYPLFKGFFIFSDSTAVDTEWYVGTNPERQSETSLEAPSLASCSSLAICCISTVDSGRQL